MLSSDLSLMSTTPPRTVRTRSLSSFWSGIAQIIAFLLLLVMSSWIAWQTPLFWNYPGSLPLVGLTVLAFAVSVGFLDQIRRIPRTNPLSRNLLAASVAFLGILGIVALGRIYYSRSFLVASYLGTLFWLTLSHLLLSRVRRPRYALVPGGLSGEAASIREADWLPLSEARVPHEAVDGVVVDLHQNLSPEWVRLVAECTLRGIPVHHSAYLTEVLTGRVSVDHLSRGLIDEIRTPAGYLTVKRAMDVFLVLVSLPVVLPLLALLALVIRLDSPGPVLFLQERRGRAGSRFRMVKFRTMRVSESSEAKFAAIGDSRVTRSGHILRKLRLDELPQLWNILIGEMSLIGPRPEQVPFAEGFEREIPFYGYRHVIRPGLTGWAQVHHGYADGLSTTKQKLEYDLFYIKNLSFTLDVTILFQTFRTILFGFGAR